MAQTPQQRQANKKFAKNLEGKMGKAPQEVKRKTDGRKAPISPVWLGLLGFVVFGGLLFELVSRIFFK